MATFIIHKTYGELYYHPDTEVWVLDRIEPHVSIKLKHLFRKIATYARSPYTLQDSDEIAADLYWFTQRYPLKMSVGDREHLRQRKERYEQDIAEMERILLPNWQSSNPVFLKGIPRKYQSQYAEIIQRTKVGICGDDVGLGKTYTGITAICDERFLPAAIVVQTHSQKQWEEKIVEFSFLSTHIIKTKKPYNLPSADTYIFRYSQIEGWVNFFETGYFKAVVFDEIQELRTGIQSGKGSAASVLCHYADMKLGMSASPMYNYPIEIWNIFDILSPGCLFTPEEFLREWTTTNYYDKNQKALCSDPKALGSYLRERFLLVRRTREDVGRELPPKSTIVHTVDYDKTAVQDFDNMLKMLAEKTLYSDSFNERGIAARELDMRTRQVTGVSKARYVAEFVRILLDNDEPVILVGWHREVYRIWQQQLKEYNPLLYTGSETIKQKEDTKTAFINGETKLLILSLRSGVGIDGFQFTNCSTVVFGELDWSPEVHKQVSGRLWRDGQEKKVMEIFLISDYGSDPLIVDLLGIKASQANSILNPYQSVTEANYDDSRLKLLAKRILKIKE